MYHVSISSNFKYNNLDYRSNLLLVLEYRTIRCIVYREIFMRKYRKMRIELIARIGIVLCVILFGLWTYNATPVEMSEAYKEPYILGDSWTQVVGDTRIELESLEDVQEIEVGEPLVLEIILPEVRDSAILFFFSENQEIRVYVEDELIYEFVMQEEYEILGTPGSTWNEVALSETMSGDKLRIEITSQFAYYHMVLNQFIIATEGECISLYLEEMGIFIAMALVILLLAIISYVNGNIWKRSEMKRYIINMGDLYFCVALWLLSETGVWDVFTGRPIFSYVLSMLMLRILPIVFWKFSNASLPRKYKLMGVWHVWCWVNLIGTIIAQVCFGISFVSLLLYNNLLIVTGGIVTIGIYITSFRTLSHTIYKKRMYLLNIILIVASTVDVVLFYLLPECTVIMGLMTAAALIVYALIVHVILLNHETQTDVAKIRIEQEYNRLQSTTLLQQIKAHFIFNTLNAISALCKQDAHAADNAIKLFAKYLRRYMYLINQQNNISIRSELDLVEAYLEIERLRFGERFSFNIKTEYEEFEIPPLTLQPIVENAMNHGLSTQVSKGHIDIEVTREYNVVKIVVVDNGVGFDVSILEGNESIGLQNIKKRLSLMADGRIEIKSVKNEGTEVIVYIPLKDEVDL